MNYGFNLLATGFPGARRLTSDFLGLSLLLGGSAVVFVSLYFLLKSPVQMMRSTEPTQPAGLAPNVGVELVADERDTSSHRGLYSNLKLIGYFFTALGLFSAADLTLQVFIRSLFNELRWWIEILLVTFGVLSYAIFSSIGRLGAEEEPLVSGSLPRPTSEESAPDVSKSTPSSPEVLEVEIDNFSKGEAGELEKHVFADSYDIIRLEPKGVTIWREDRRGLRSLYLSGPYELDWNRVREAVTEGRELRVGSLHLPLKAARDLLALHEGAIVESSTRAT